VGFNTRQVFKGNWGEKGENWREGHAGIRFPAKTQKSKELSRIIFKLFLKKFAALRLCGKSYPFAPPRATTLQ
jgi:hypothetical protein